MQYNPGSFVDLSKKVDQILDKVQPQLLQSPYIIESNPVSDNFGRPSFYDSQFQLSYQNSPNDYNMLVSLVQQQNNTIQQLLTMVTHLYNQSNTNTQLLNQLLSKQYI